MDGHSHGKLLPRFAGPIVEFLCRRPEATRVDVLDFIDQTFGVRVARIALCKFLKKYGLDRVGAAAPAPVPATVAATVQAQVAPPPDPPTTRPVVTPAPPLCSDARASRARS